MARPSRSPALAAAVATLALLSSCSDGKSEVSPWAADLIPGKCANPVYPPRPTGDLSAAGPEPAGLERVRQVNCAASHFMEVYARFPYSGRTPGSDSSSNITPTTETAPPLPYPGRDQFQKFAREACARHFRAYLGSTPREPWMVLTYLYPSASSWLSASSSRRYPRALKRLMDKPPTTNRDVFCVIRSSAGYFSGSLRGPQKPVPSPARTHPAPEAGTHEPEHATPATPPSTPAAWEAD